MKISKKIFIGIILFIGILKIIDFIFSHEIIVNRIINFGENICTGNGVKAFENLTDNCVFILNDKVVSKSEALTNFNKQYKVKPFKGTIYLHDYKKKKMNEKVVMLVAYFNFDGNSIEVDGDMKFIRSGLFEWKVSEVSSKDKTFISAFSE